MPVLEVLAAGMSKRPGRGAVYAPKIVRIVYQAFFLLVFLAALWAMTDEGIRRFPVKWMFHLNPLSAVGMLASSWIVTSGLLWALATVALTVVFGRAFCGWICPVGTLHHLVSWATRKIRRGPPIEANRFRSHFRLKYLLLIAALVAAAAGSLLSGLLDPLSLAARSLGSAISPALHTISPVGGFRARIFAGAWVTGAVFIALLVLNRWIARWWCRALCPLGALLGWISRAAIYRIEVDPDTCTHCNRCAADCQGADEPFAKHRVSECHVCLNCLDACPEGAIAFRAFAPTAAPSGGVDLRRRQILGAALAGAALVPLSRATAGSASSPSPLAIRPPGACPEEEFLARCVRCGACVNACPTTALQPSMGEAGIEGVYTPVLVPRRGWCEPSCTLCGHVCPTGAIRPLAPDEKGWTKPEAEALRIGTAFFDLGRCLPWGADIPCIVCQEVCPTSPKAIWLEPVTVPGRDGVPVKLQRPHMDPARCVGCGLCETKCPVNDLAAVRVTRVGESRSRGSAFTLRPLGRSS
jgi:MauM/NapG family ferredoxin protein